MDSNEDYCPPETIYYEYGAKKFLNSDISLFADTNEYSSIVLCVYRVNTNGKFPFLQFLLNYDSDFKLSLPSIPLFSTFNKFNLISYSKVFLSGILQVIDFEPFIDKIRFDGFYEFNSSLYLFYDVTNCEYHLYDTYSTDPLRFALTDEILNHRKICNLKISPVTTNFFLKNDQLNYLYDKNNEVYEIPIVGFVGKSTPEKLNFTNVFGESSKDKTAILGPYYYFTDYFNAIRNGGWSCDYKPETIFDKTITDNENGRYIKGGIVRFALFTGKTKYIENMPNDPIDESEIKNFRLEDTKADKKYEIQTLRISDHDGNWAKEYDSVYLGNIELDDGSLLRDVPMFVMKEYNQQIPLSYHFINKMKLGDKFDPENFSYTIV
jgi:hypothetical protein